MMKYKKKNVDNESQ